MAKENEMKISEIKAADGWRAYRGSKSFPYSNLFYQKRIEKNGLTLYFINIVVYDLPANYRYMSECDFFDKAGQQFSVRLHAFSEKKTEYVEAFFADIYERMGCVPDIDNN